MTDYAFAIAFNSAAEPLDSSSDIAPSYAWAVRGMQGWRGHGQRPGNRAERMRANQDTLKFVFVDTAASPVDRIGNLAVEFTAGPNPIPNQAASPIDGGPPDVWILVSPVYNNIGCNVVGRGADSASFAIVNAGDFELKVSFTAAGKKFGVDPEMEVIR